VQPTVNVVLRMGKLKREVRGRRGGMGGERKRG
jgi:hypothetical protein